MIPLRRKLALVLMEDGSILDETLEECLLLQDNFKATDPTKAEEEYNERRLEIYAKLADKILKIVSFHMAIVLGDDALPSSNG